MHFIIEISTALCNDFQAYSTDLFSEPSIPKFGHYKVLKMYGYLCNGISINWLFSFVQGILLLHQVVGLCMYMYMYGHIHNYMRPCFT